MERISKSLYLEGESVKYGPARARYERRKRRRQVIKAYAWLWKTITVIFTICMIAIVGWYFWPFTSYGGGGNQQEQIPTRTFSSDEIIQQVEKTKTNAEVVLLETQKPNPTFAPTQITPTPEDESMFTFSIQSRPENISAGLFNTEHTCNWMGVAGQAFDLQGRPVPGITVQITSRTIGNDTKFLGMTGSALAYGEGGYEIFLTDKLIETSGEFEIRLVDQLGRGLSPKYVFNTCSDCQKNLTIINFKQIK